ncbi:MAG: hypothetical protein Q9227_005100 [Pyrenula ochraceoflavens]
MDLRDRTAEPYGNPILEGYDFYENHPPFVGWEELQQQINQGADPTQTHIGFQGGGNRQCGSHQNTLSSEFPLGPSVALYIFKLGYNTSFRALKFGGKWYLLSRSVLKEGQYMFFAYIGGYAKWHRFPVAVSRKPKDYDFNRMSRIVQDLGGLGIADPTTAWAEFTGNRFLIDSRLGPTPDNITADPAVARSAPSLDSETPASSSLSSLPSPSSPSDFDISPASLAEHQTPSPIRDTAPPINSPDTEIRLNPLLQSAESTLLPPSTPEPTEPSDNRALSTTHLNAMSTGFLTIRPVRHTKTFSEPNWNYGAYKLVREPKLPPMRYTSLRQPFTDSLQPGQIKRVISAKDPFGPLLEVGFFRWGRIDGFWAGPGPKAEEERLEILEIKGEVVEYAEREGNEMGGTVMGLVDGLTTRMLIESALMAVGCYATSEQVWEALVSSGALDTVMY